MLGAVAAGFFPVWIEDDPQRVRPVLERGARSCIGGETHHSAADGIADDPCRCAFAGDARPYLDFSGSKPAFVKVTENSFFRFTVIVHGVVQVKPVEVRTSAPLSVPGGDKWDGAGPSGFPAYVIIPLKAGDTAPGTVPPASRTTSPRESTVRCSIIPVLTPLFGYLKNSS